MNLQYINDQHGNPLYVVLPIEEYQRLIADDDDQWEDIPYSADEFDDVTLPNEVVSIMIDKDVSAIAAWRIYRGLTQAQAAEQAGITQAALSQIEKKGTKPQAKTREQFASIYQCHADQLAV